MTLNNRASLTLSAALPFVFFFLPLAEARAEETSNKSRKWDLTLGVGALSLPEYPGSDDNKTEVLPLINARYNRFLLVGLLAVVYLGG
ncbi:MipA/OmpV family protein [Acinetobacter vivianii]